MMGSCMKEEDDQFFDSPDELSEYRSDCSQNLVLRGNSLSVSGSNSVVFELWTKKLDSVDERRRKLLQWMGISVDDTSGDMSCDDIGIECGSARISEKSGAVLRTSVSEDEFSCSDTFLSFRSSVAELFENDNVEGNFISEAKALVDGPEFSVDELTRSISIRGLSKGGSSQSLTAGSFQTQGSSPPVHHLLWTEGEASNFSVVKKKLKQGWLRRLGIVACIANGHVDADLHDHFDPVISTRTQKVPVYSQNKGAKDLSSLFVDQEFLAHGGFISTMKFSLDGQYLATAGEDGIVRVWKVIEEERSSKFDILRMDPSSLYFSVNDCSELSLLNVDKDKPDKVRRPKKLSDLTCVIFPPNVFHLVEKPLHEFHGHDGEILDLSWSAKGYLLSSSVDKTVRLWQVGCDQCLRVFSHNNYVTCIEFNPVDDNYFISGSIDGKVRIWEVLGRQVVDWTDIREIVTAVCYRPDGKGGIVGTMTGNCCFYDITDNKLQLDTQRWLQGKKRLPSRRITGFQFCPSDPSKVMISSADSHVRILSGLDIISKFKGHRNAGSQISASFSADGRHILSTGEDSNVYIWNYTSQENKISFFSKKTWSSESFFSHNASISVPWCGMSMPQPPFLPPETLVLPSTFSSDLLSRSCTNDGRKLHDTNSFKLRPISTSNSFSLSPGLLLEPSPRGSATWPEETFCSSSPAAGHPQTPRVWKSGYKFIKNACQTMSSSPHMWGMVIVTAGWDGRIRTFHNYGLPVHH